MLSGKTDNRELEAVLFLLFADSVVYDTTGRLNDVQGERRGRAEGGDLVVFVLEMPELPIEAVEGEPLVVVTCSRVPKRGPGL